MFIIAATNWGKRTPETPRNCCIVAFVSLTDRQWVKKLTAKQLTCHAPPPLFQGVYVFSVLGLLLVATTYLVADFWFRNFSYPQCNSGNCCCICLDLVFVCVCVWRFFTFFFAIFPDPLPLRPFWVHKL